MVQVLPAMWIWAAMLDLKVHVLHGKAFHVLTGPAIVIPLVLAVAVDHRGELLPERRVRVRDRPAGPAADPAGVHPGPVSTCSWSSGRARSSASCSASSTVVVVALGEVLVRASPSSIVVGVMMVCYVAIPSRLIGMKTIVSKRDKLAASVVGGAIGAVVCTPPYALGRVGLIMLGSSTHVIFVLGVIFFAVGLTLQAGATGAVKTVKMSAKLVLRASPPPDP